MVVRTTPGVNLQNNELSMQIGSPLIIWDPEREACEGERWFEVKFRDNKTRIRVRALSRTKARVEAAKIFIKLGLGDPWAKDPFSRVWYKLEYSRIA